MKTRLVSEGLPVMLDELNTYINVHKVQLMDGLRRNVLDQCVFMFGHKNVSLFSQKSHVGCVLPEVMGGTNLPI